MQDSGVNLGWLVRAADDLAADDLVVDLALAEVTSEGAVMAETSKRARVSGGDEVSEREQQLVELIIKKLGFTNGWAIEAERYTQLCYEIAHEWLAASPGAPSGKLEQPTEEYPYTTQPVVIAGALTWEQAREHCAKLLDEIAKRLATSMPPDLVGSMNAMQYAKALRTLAPPTGAAPQLSGAVAESEANAEVGGNWIDAAPSPFSGGAKREGGA